MTVECFLDTNVLLYAAVGGKGEEAKRKRAMRIIEAGSFGTSAQVLGEFYVNAVRKAAVPLDPTVAAEWVERISTFPVVAVDAGLVSIAIDISVRYRLSYWDAGIIAAAEALGVKILYSEDFNDGQVYGAVRAENPFRGL
jgi:predicted nucleic acid-binding protein